MAGSEYVAAAIERIRLLPKTDGDEGWKANRLARIECATAFETEAYGRLHCLDVVPGQWFEGGASLVGDLSAPDEIACLANGLWAILDGAANPQRGSAIIQAACIEFARAQFDSALSGVCHAVDDGDEIAMMMAARPWHDADSIARAPLHAWWFNETATDGFGEWLSSAWKKRGLTLPGRDGRDPEIPDLPVSDEASMHAALALVWLDEALRNPGQSMALMANIAHAFAQVGHIHGKGGSGGSSEFARRGAAARHAGNRACKAGVIKLYQAGSYSSKDTAAEAIAQQLGVPFRTVRGYLVGI